MRKPVIVSIVGRTNSGKTTLIEKLVPELKRKGYSVGTIKHDAHSFEIDHPGKDSWRHAMAGADSVLISSSSKLAFIKKTSAELSLDELALMYFGDVDIIVAEGYKSGNKPKIEVFRPGLHERPLCTVDDNLIAIVSDQAVDVGVPCFRFVDVEDVVRLIEEHLDVKNESSGGFETAGKDLG